MPDPKFSIGQRVNRIEMRDIVGATVISFEPTIYNIGSDYVYYIKYDEGGFGYWPENSLEAIVE